MKGRVRREGYGIDRDLGAIRRNLLRYLRKNCNGLLLIVDRSVCGVSFQILDLRDDERRENRGE